MKVYTKVKTIEPGSAENNWNGYYELSYKEYNENGRLIREGTEDFNGIRLRTLTRYIVRAVYGENVARTIKF